MRYPTVFLLLAIVCFVSHETQAQTPDVAVRYYRMGEKKIHEGDWAGAVEAFTKAIVTNAYFNGAKVPKKGTNGDSFDASQSQSTEVSVSDRFTARAYACRGLVRVYLGDFDQAIADYDRALRIQSKLVEAYVGRGIARDSKGDHDGALVDYNRAISIEPKSAYAYFRRGNILVEKSDFGGALRDFDRVLELEPNYAWAHSARGRTLMKQRQFELAAAAFTTALKLDPTMEEAYGNRGLSLIVMGRETEGLADLKKSIELRPELKSDLERRTEIARKLSQVTRLRQR